MVAATRLAAGGDMQCVHLRKKGMAVYTLLCTAEHRS